MTGMVGADVAELEQFATALDRGASQLAGLSGSVRNGIQISAWVGQVAARFRADWASQHSKVLTQAANDLREAARHVRLQAQQQREASGAGAGRSSSTVGVGSGSKGRVTGNSLLDDYQAVVGAYPWIAGALGALGAGATFGANSSLVGRYAKNDLWASTRYKQTFSRLFGGRVFKVNGPWHQLSQSKAFAKVGRGLGIVGLAASVEDFQKNPSVGGAVTVVESSLKASRHPVHFLAGMAISSVHLAVDKGLETDWSSSGFQSVTEAIARDGVEDIVIGGAADGFTKFFKEDIWRVF